MTTKLARGPCAQEHLQKYYKRKPVVEKFLQQLHSIISKVHETEMHDFLKEPLSQRKKWKICVTKRNFKGDLVTFVNGISGQMARKRLGEGN